MALDELANHLVKITSEARISRKQSNLQSTLTMAESRGLAAEHTAVVDAQALLNELDEEDKARSEAAATLRSAIDSARTSREVEVLESAITAAGKLLHADDSLMVEANTLVQDIYDERQRVTDARERLRLATESVRESYETSYLKDEIALAFDSGVTKDFVEMTDAHALHDQIVSELTQRLREATEFATSYQDVENLQQEVDYCGHVLLAEGPEAQEVVAESKAKVAFLTDCAHSLAISVQRHARAFLARKTLERLKRERDDDINNIFGDLGAAMTSIVEKGFEHKERQKVEGEDDDEPGLVEVFLTNNVQFKHLYASPEITVAAEQAAIFMQKHARRILAERAYQEYKDNHLKRQDASGQWYTKAQFVEYYGGETEWHQAVLSQAVE